ncbi:MAG TPA: amino acid adenylation domain-containing protein [Pyrinomonadaceae bacterium]
MTEDILHGYRLSPLQERLWLLQQQSVGDAFHGFCAVRLRGRFDVGSLAQALRLVATRHEILRTTFREHNGHTPLQFISESPRFSFQHRDLSAMEAEAQRTAIDSHSHDIRFAPFDLASSPTLQAHLLSLSVDEKLLMWRMPALCSDSGGLSLLVEDVAVHYNSLVSNNPPPSSLSLQFVDVAEWQHELLEAKETKAGVEYWRRQNWADALATRLPFGRFADRHADFQPRSYNIPFDAALASHIKALVGDERAAMEAFLLLCWCVLLGRHAEQARMVVGVRRDGRNLEDIRDVVGVFARYLPVEVDVQEQLPLAVRAAELSRALRDASKKQHLFSWKFEQQEGGETGTPFFPVTFNLEERAQEFSTAHGAFHIEQLECLVDRFSLELEARLHGDDACSLRLQYDAGCFAETEIACLASQFQTLLADAINRPDASIRDLKLLSEAERHRALVTFNDTTSNVPPSLLLHQLFEQQAALAPERPAVLHAGKQLTYAELNERAEMLARHLRRRGVQPDEAVGICSEDGIEMVVGIFGILKAGAAYLPLDPHNSPERLRFMIEDSRASFVVAPGRLHAELNMSGVQLLEFAEMWKEEPQDGGTDTLSDVIHNDATLAYIIYTSGSTGRPKGVQITHANAVHSTWARFEYYPQRVKAFLLLSPFAFDSSVAGIFWTLGQGGALVIPPRDARSDLRVLDGLIAEHKISHLLALPSLYSQLLEYGTPETLALLSVVIVAGEACPKELLARHLTALPRTRFYNEYGPTEVSVWSVVYEARQDERLNSVPIGHPISRTRLYVLDELREPVPIGVNGELYIEGTGLARGYHNRADVTALAFVPHPLSTEPGARLYKTGDRMRLLPDGNIEFIGRVDRQVKVRGFRIELGEIETALREHASVAECAAIAHEWKPGEKRLVAFVVQRGEQAASDDELRVFLRNSLPEYMVPPVVIHLPELPITENSKIDYQSLSALAAKPASVVVEKSQPVTAREKLLVEIWKGVLQLDSIGIHDNFFTLGGDSILALQVAARANQAGMKLMARQLFSSPTIAALAAVSTSSKGNSTIAAEQGIVEGSVPLTPIQRWFLDAEPLHPDHFNHSLILELHDEPDEALLRRVTARLIEHHDALRHRFIQTPSGWEQFCASPNDVVPFALVDLSTLPEAERKRALRSQMEAYAQSLNLADGSNLRVVLFRLQADAPCLLLIVIHHLVVDGISWRILLEDFQTLYRGLKNKEEVVLPLKTVAFRDWARHLAAHQAGSLNEELDWWLAQPWERVRPLPIDLDEGDNTEETVEVVSDELAADATHALLEGVAAAQGADVEEILLAALAQSLTTWTGDPALLVELEHHGREAILGEVDISRTVGWFTSAFPLILEASGTDSLAEVVGAVKQRLRNVPHHGVGYGLLRYGQDKSVASQLAGLPQPEVRFNYLGRFDNIQTGERLISLSTEPTPAPRSPRAVNNMLVECNALVADGRLRFEWRYSSRRHHRHTIASLSRHFMDALRAFINEGRKVEARSLASGATHAFGIERKTLDRLASEFGSIEDVYPLAPLQEGMLFHSLLAPESGVYFQQMMCRIRGAFNAADFRRAWAEMVEIHPTLRTRFAWSGLARPLQVVVPEATVSLNEQDWSDLSSEQQRVRLNEFLLADRQRGCDLMRGPLFRISLFRLDNDSFHLVLSHHHMLMDGWSMAMLLKQVMDSYEQLRRGQPLTRDVSPPSYRDYIDWLARQDMAQAEAFWSRTLAGFTEPTLLSSAAPSIDDEVSYDERDVRLSAEATAALEAFGRQHGLTLNTLVQGAWALELCLQSGREDVVFGVTVAGRPAHLRGVESMLGLFINALPLRVVLSTEESLLVWLKQLQERMVELRDYEYSPLALVRQWSEIPAGAPLFESVVVFENYPVEMSLESPGDGLVIDNVRVIEQNDRPLTLMAIPGREMKLQINYRQQHFDDGLVERMLTDLCDLLQQITAHPQQQIGSLLNDLDRETSDLASEFNQII